MHNGELALGCREKGDGHSQDHSMSLSIRSRAPVVRTEDGSGGREDAEKCQFQDESTWAGYEFAMPSQLTATGIRLEDLSSSPWGGRRKEAVVLVTASLINKQPIPPLLLCPPARSHQEFL